MLAYVYPPKIARTVGTILDNFRLWPRMSAKWINGSRYQQPETDLIECYLSCIGQKKFG